jgi:steroid delta-isomerase-like uncharacterized protein
MPASKSIDSLVREFVDACNSPRLEVWDRLLTDDCLFVRNDEKTNGLGKFKDRIRELRQAFPDLRLNVEETIIAADKFVLRWYATGTHRGAYLGFPATGQQIRYSGINIVELDDELKLVEKIYTLVDNLAILRCLGARPVTSDEARPPL